MAASSDIATIRGPAADRRRMLDAALAQMSPAYYFALQRYHRVLAQRNMELRSGRNGSLDAWDAQLVVLGTRITVQRKKYVRLLATHVGPWFTWLGERGALEMIYRPAWDGNDEEEISTCARLYIQRMRVEEIKRAQTLSGPHRDEVAFVLNGQPLRGYGSQGQWRTAMLAVRFGERALMKNELKGEPLMVFDDALAELDESRRRRVLTINDAGQMIVSVTGLPDTVRTEGVLVVEEGHVREHQWSPRSAIS